MSKHLLSQHHTQHEGAGKPSGEVLGGPAGGWETASGILLATALCSPQLPAASAAETRTQMCLLDPASREVLLSQLWTASLQLSALPGFASAAKSHFSQERGLPRAATPKGGWRWGFKDTGKAIKSKKGTTTGSLCSRVLLWVGRSFVGPLRQFGIVLGASLCDATIPLGVNNKHSAGQLPLSVHLQRTQPAAPGTERGALEPLPLSHCRLAACNPHTGACKTRSDRSPLSPPPPNAG